MGILDMYGFERTSRTTNECNGDFEALVINFANEKLQQHFNENTFKTEEALYKSERVDFTPATYNGDFVLRICV